MAIRHSSHARFELWYHFAWSTKYRKRIWTDDAVRAEVKELFRTVAAHYDLEIGSIELLSDHIHLTVTAPPRIAPARLAQILKSVTTKRLFAQYPWLRQHYWGGELWVAGYFVRTTGPGLTKEQVERYISGAIRRCLSSAAGRTSPDACHRGALLRTSAG